MGNKHGLYQNMIAGVASRADSDEKLEAAVDGPEPMASKAQEELSRRAKNRNRPWILGGGQN